MAPVAAPLSISLFPAPIRCIFNQLTRIQCKFIRFSSRLEFLNLLKLHQSVLFGLLVKSSANLSHHLCLQLHQRVINQYSSSIMEIVIMECHINITACTQRFVQHVHLLQKSVSVHEFHYLFRKLAEVGHTLITELQAKKSRKINTGHFHSANHSPTDMTEENQTSLPHPSTVVNPSPDEDPNTSTHNVASQPETSKRRRRWIKRTLGRAKDNPPLPTRLLIYPVTNFRMMRRLCSQKV